ncbi:MAG TPA: protein kinase, partial [Candidatus Polarisedimenticolia bacterium]|nr:protein kinase [Candidatus Polarisedimenticolia bacterium]
MVRSSGSSGGSGPGGFGGGRALPDKIGPYPIKGHLGGGGQGDVYLGFHPSFEIDVAIKVLNEAFREPEQLARIKVEAQTMVRLAAPNVVRVYDFNLEGPYLVMEYCKHGDLTHYIMTRRRHPLSETIGIVRQICDALVVAHEHDPPILHRDIKPANVLFHNGVPKVTDFGLAKMLGGGSGLTSTRGPMGTPRYMSPEQLQDASRVDQRTDLWAVGIILYELLTWSRPFDKSGDTYFNIMLRTRTEPPRKPPYDLPGPIMAVIQRALEKEPENRFRSAREMRDALDQALREIPDAARMLLPPEEVVDDLSRLSARVADHLDSGQEQEAYTLIQEICQAAPENSIGKYWRKRVKQSGRSGGSSGGAVDTAGRVEGEQAADEIIAIRRMIEKRDFRGARVRCGEIISRFPDNTVVHGLLDTIRKAEAGFRQDLDEAHSAADAARARGDFRAVHAIWTGMDGKYPGDRDIKAEFVVAAREKEIAEQREARAALDQVLVQRRRDGDLNGAAQALRDYASSYPHDQDAARDLRAAEEELRSRARADRIAALRAQTAALRTAGGLSEAVARWEALLQEYPDADEAARELQSLRAEIAAQERQRRLGLSRARAADLSARGELRGALQEWTSYQLDYPDDRDAAAEIESLNQRIGEQRRRAMQSEIDRLAGTLQARLEAGRYASLTGVGVAAGEVLRAARTSTSGDLDALDGLRRKLVAAIEQGEESLADQLAAQRAEVQKRLAELSDWLPAGSDVEAAGALPAEQDLRRAMAAGLGALCDLQASDVVGDPIERMAAAARAMDETTTALSRERQQALDAAKHAAGEALTAARAMVDRLVALAQEIPRLEGDARPLAARLEQLESQVDSRVPERLTAMAAQLQALREEASSRLLEARWQLSSDLAAMIHQGRILLLEAPVPALQDLIARTLAALRENTAEGKGAERTLAHLRGELGKELGIAAGAGKARLDEARERWQAALKSWREVLSADLGSGIAVEGRRIEIAGDTALSTSRAEDLIGWAAQLEGLTRRYRLESVWIEQSNDVLEIEGPLASDGLPHGEPEPAQRRLLADYRRAIVSGNGDACRALGPELKKQAGARQAGDDRSPGELPPVPPLSKSLRRFNELYAAGNLRSFDELASRYEKSRSQRRGAEASRLEEELEASYGRMLRPPPIWRGPVVQWAGAALAAVLIAWLIIVPTPPPTSVTLLSPAGETVITEVLRNGTRQEGLSGEVPEEGRTWADLEPGRYAVKVAGGDRTVEFVVPGQSLVLLPGGEVDYPRILL